MCAAAVETSAPLDEVERGAARVLRPLLAEYDGHLPDGARLYFAPGRINLMGDHIDYVGGQVLPMALQRGTWLLSWPVATPGVHVHALDLDEHLQLQRDDLAHWQRRGSWHDFVAGALAADADGADDRIDAGWRQGLELRVSGNLRGGGLSSSASLAVGLCLALADAGLCVPRQGMALARHARRIEHTWVGVACGLMDPAAVVLGQAGAALSLDCATQAWTPVPLSWGERSLLVMHSGVSRELSSSGYNTRRAELARGLHRLGCAPDAVPALGQAALMDIDDDDLELRRVRHVVHEQHLAREAMNCARADDWSGFGAAMTASHASLRDDYDVSCGALDRLVDAACNTPGCEGARLTGAGFGGWAIALVRDPAVDWVLQAVDAALGRPADAANSFVAQPCAGARELSVSRCLAASAS